MRHPVMPATLRALLPPLILLLVACVATAVETAERFKMVLLPDTQKYTEMAPGPDNPYFIQTQWIKSNAQTANIKFVTHLGDIVNDRDVVSQWQVADAAMAILETDTPMPYSVAPGNHDLKGTGSPFYIRDTSMYNTYFGVDRFEEQPWYEGHYGSNNDNNISFFSVDNLDFMVVALELHPRDSVLDWADRIIKRNPNRRVIVETHKYLKPDGTRYTDTAYGGVYGNSGEQLFEKLISPNPNIFMVVCGHVTEEGFNLATNDSGGQVIELLTDYQNLTNGGNGWLRVLDFIPALNQINIRSYSPVTGQWNLHGWFSVEYDMGGTPTMPPPAVLVGHWALDDGMGNPAATTAVDQTGNGPPAVLTNFATPPAWQAGKLGGALRFDGLNDRVTTGTPEELFPDGAFSVSLWLDKLGRPRGTFGALVGIDEYGVSPNDAFLLAIGGTSSKIEFCVQQSDFTYDSILLEGNTALTTGLWYHLAAVFQPGQRMAIYINGVLDAEMTTGVPYDVNMLTDALLTIGNLNAAGGVDNCCFNGLLDQIRFYAGILTDAQIAELAAEVFVPPGDANGDGKVDQADATALAAHWNTVGGATREQGDFNGDGNVDAADASIMAANWGYGTSEAAGVPEPGGFTLLLSLVATGGLAARHRRRHAA